MRRAYVETLMSIGALAIVLLTLVTFDARVRGQVSLWLSTPPAAQVAEVSQALSRPDLESQAAARFDAARMSQLKIYPGWRPSDAEWVMDSFRRLRDFYSDGAGKGRAMVTCLV